MRAEQIQLKKALDIANGKRRYIRRGKCNRCGACCVNEDCKYLEFTEDLLAVCTIHNSENRELKCKLYPENPPLNFETCGYYFIDKSDNRKIGYGDRL